MAETGDMRIPFESTLSPRVEVQYSFSSYLFDLPAVEETSESLLLAECFYCPHQPLYCRRDSVSAQTPWLGAAVRGFRRAESRFSSPPFGDVCALVCVAVQCSLGSSLFGLFGGLQSSHFALNNGTWTW